MVRPGQQHLEDLPLVVHCHERQEAASDDKGDGVERAQAAPSEPGATREEPEQRHGQAGSEVPEPNWAPHDGDERRAADQHHAREEKEVESERHEEERLAN
jgi:hypothetical protein